jgi:predicted DNA-binding transcriptional regulator AlpA
VLDGDKQPAATACDRLAPLTRADMGVVVELISPSGCDVAPTAYVDNSATGDAAPTACVDNGATAEIVDTLTRGALYGAITFLESIRPLFGGPARDTAAPVLMLSAPDAEQSVAAKRMSPGNDDAPFELLDEKQMCALVGISPVTAAKWRARADGPRFLKIGRLVRYRRTDVQAWLASRTRG